MCRGFTKTNGAMGKKERGVMPITKKEFWKWMETFPSSDTPDDDWFTGNIDEGFVSVVFNVDEDEEEVSDD